MHQDQHRSTGGFQGRFDRLNDALAGIAADADAVDHDLDRVFAVLFELDVLVQRHDLAVDPDADESRFAGVVEDTLVDPLAAANNRG